MHQCYHTYGTWYGMLIQYSVQLWSMVGHKNLSLKPLWPTEIEECQKKINKNLNLSTWLLYFQCVFKNWTSVFVWTRSSQPLSQHLFNSNHLKLNSFITAKGNLRKQTGCISRKILHASTLFPRRIFLISIRSKRTYNLNTYWT